MNNLQMLTKALEEEPFNTILAAMLTDELIDVRDATRTEADRQVTNVIQTGILAASLIRAAKLMAPGTRSRPKLLRALLAFLDLPHQTAWTVVVVSGRDHRITVSDDFHMRGGFWASGTILAGADWLCEEWERITDTIRRARKRRKKSK